MEYVNLTNKHWIVYRWGWSSIDFHLDIKRYGGFQSHGGTPKWWFIPWKIELKWMLTGVPTFFNGWPYIIFTHVPWPWHSVGVPWPRQTKTTRKHGFWPQIGWDFWVSSFKFPNSGSFLLINSIQRMIVFSKWIWYYGHIYNYIYIYIHIELIFTLWQSTVAKGNPL